MAAIGSHRKIGADFQISRRSFSLNPHDFSSFFDDLADLGLHPQVKRRITPGVLSDKIQKIPLGHKSEKLAVSWKVREVGDGHGFVADLTRQVANFLVGTL